MSFYKYASYILVKFSNPFTFYRLSLDPDSTRKTSLFYPLIFTLWIRVFSRFFTFNFVVFCGKMGNLTMYILFL